MKLHTKPHERLFKSPMYVRSESEEMLYKYGVARDHAYRQLKRGNSAPWMEMMRTYTVRRLQIAYDEARSHFKFMPIEQAHCCPGGCACAT